MVNLDGISKKLLTNKNTQNKRIKICMACKKFKNNVCDRCHCFMPVKSWIKIAKCPDGKW